MQQKPADMDNATLTLAVVDGFPMEKIMRFFAFMHLPDKLRPMSRKFAEMALTIMYESPNGSAERTTALRKLLESKDCAVRSLL